MSEDVTPYGTKPPDESRVDELRALALQLGWPQAEVARQLEWPYRDVRHWFSGKFVPPIGALYALRYLAQQKGAAARVADVDRS